MGPIQVVVEDGNNLVLEVTPTPNTTVILDRGIAGPVGPMGDGDVDGPASSTDNAVARFDGTTGKVIQNSLVTVSDTGAVAGVTTLAASGAVTLSGGTANGVAYLNGSKVLTSGTGLVFDGSNLTLGSAIKQLGSTNTFWANSPTGANGGIGFLPDGKGAGSHSVVSYIGGSTFTQLNLEGSQIGFYLGTTGSSSEQMRLTNIGLGIGTSSPGAKLDVATTTGFTFDTTSTAGVRIGAQGTSGGSFMVQTQSASASYGSGLAVDGTYSSGTLQSTVNIKAFGVYSGGGYGSSLAFHTSSGTTLSQKMLLDSSGNLGLGVTPSAWGSGYRALQIGTHAVLTQGSSDTYLGNNWLNDGANKYLNNGAASIYGQASGAHAWYTAPSGTAGNAISFSQVMTLDAAGSLVVGGTTAIAGSVLTLQETASLSAALSLKNRNSTQTWKIAVDATAVDDKILAFIENAGSSVRMALTDTGNLGLGVTPSAWDTYKSFELGQYGYISSGASWMELMMNTYYGSGNYRYKGTGQASHYLQQSGTHQWFTAPSGTAGNAISFTQAMTLDSNGNLGVGTTSPRVRLQVTPSSNPDFPSLGTANAGSVFTSANGQYGLNLGVAPSGYAWMQVMRFDGAATAYNMVLQAAGGSLLVGTSTSAFTAKQEIVQTADTPTAYFFRNNAATNAGFVLRHGGATGAATATQVEFLRADSVTVGSITSTVSATAYNTSSDYRLKNITGPITTSGAYIDSLNPVEGTWKADGSTFVGLIAHEVQEASRTPVATGVKDGKDMQAMDYSNAELIANMLAELKSLRARVAQLEAA
jgi:hypothetical protein